MQILKIKNFLFDQENATKGLIMPTIQDYLFNLELSGKQSYNRSRFVNLHLVPAAKQVAETKKTILEKNTKKDKEGKLLFQDPKTKKESTEIAEGKVYAIADLKVFEKEMVDFLNDETLIDITPSNSQMISDIREGIDNDKTIYKATDGVRYMQYRDCFEPQEAEVKK